jgi:hypothetical protein
MLTLVLGIIVSLRRRHKLTGLILLLPFIAWSATAVFFLVRPRYEQAYETLAVRQYPLIEAPRFSFAPGWEEVHYFQSQLGAHLLVKTQDGWQHLNPATLQPWPRPDDATVIRLLEDAFNANPTRYGHVATLEGDVATTTTGVTVNIDWNTLSFTQQGRDTYWINKAYDIHYLEWTGITAVDKVLGLSGLALLIYMTWSGMQLSFGWHLPARRTRAVPSSTAPREA